MIFNSYQYLLFFPIVVFIYFSIPRNNWRIILLLLASYFFYMCWNPVYIVLILASTILDYFVGKGMSTAISDKKRKFLLGLSLLGNLGVLFYFKYYNFLADNIQIILDLINPELQIVHHEFLLPVGISFYTFQTLSYTLDVYNKKLEAEHNFFRFALYVSFFPQLVAGPIERATKLLPQFLVKHNFDYQRTSDGLKLILWGLFKKIVVADRFAAYVDEVYNNPDAYSGMPIVMATVFFVFQIYCDFSGYSDIAIGSARVLGYDLMENFKGPLLSRNITELWRRWHISLSTWIRDYLYNPLMFKVRYWGNYGVVFIILLTFVAVGIWHGANWTYIVFGFLHGIVLAYESVTRKFRRNLKKGMSSSIYTVISVFLTFIFWSFTCLIFRANSLSDAGLLFGNIFNYQANFFSINIFNSRYELLELKISLIILVFMVLVHFIEYEKNIIELLQDKKIVYRWIVYIVLFLSIPLLGEYGEYKQFIYFQF